MKRKGKNHPRRSREKAENRTQMALQLDDFFFFCRGDILVNDRNTLLTVRKSGDLGTPQNGITVFFAFDGNYNGYGFGFLWIRN
ncbi:hypothetical protein Nepgr_018333 [Nepenthes gracilis]|uniref:Uncharacterized protein n=1 Tax=Nepenthes gracilis TaxID=150966 RepID=A0AAD3SSQ5_NEPGR|nr:hypothetical protein Nepgr_018333 [Nepenthes gracilis]